MMPVPTKDEFSLMKEAIAEAKKSQSEDGRAHPYVGAILADEKGNVLVRAHRGEIPGAHAEFRLFDKAREQGIETRGKTLYVTLEPCTQRGKGKTPCAIRVRDSGVAIVYIGTLDPNPGISGRGEYFLQTTGSDVRRFPSSLQAELRDLNGDFFASYEHLFPSSSLTSEADLDEPVEPLAIGSSKARDSLLLLTARMISEARFSVLMMAGELSWLKELAMTVLHASQQSVDIRIVASRSADNSDENEFRERCTAAVGIGSVVSVTKAPHGLRGLIIDGATDNAQCLVLEKQFALHGSILRAPHDGALIDAVVQAGSAMFAAGCIARPSQPSWQAVNEADVIVALQNGVPQYRGAAIQLQPLNPSTVKPLSKCLERLKLLRANHTVELQATFGLPVIAVIAGCPWPVTPPIVEKRPDGSLVVIDGTHRFYAALQRGEREIAALVVDCDAPLPSNPLSAWSDTKLLTEKVSKSERYQDFQEQHFRPCSLAFRALTAR